MPSTNFKYELMTSFCLQITRLVYGNIGVSDLWKVTVAGNILPELKKVIKIVSWIYATFRKAFQFKKPFYSRFPSGNIVNLVYFLLRFAQEVIAFNTTILVWLFPSTPKSRNSLTSRNNELTKDGHILIAVLYHTCYKQEALI